MDIVDGSGTNEEADDRSERRLFVRAVDLTDGSELAEDTDGESRPTSGEPPAYGAGDSVCSKANLGDARAGLSPENAASAALDAFLAVVGLGAAPESAGSGRIGMLMTPGVTGGGG